MHVCARGEGLGEGKVPIEILLGARCDVEGGKRRPTVIVLVLNHFCLEGKTKTSLLFSKFRLFHHNGAVAERKLPKPWWRMSEEANVVVRQKKINKKLNLILASCHSNSKLLFRKERTTPAIPSGFIFLCRSSPPHWRYLTLGRKLDWGREWKKS